MGGCDDVVVRNNVFYNCTQLLFVDTFSNPVNTGKWGRVTIHNNLLFNPIPGDFGTDGFWNGIVIDCRYNHINEVFVYNNTIVNMNGGSGGLTGGGNYGITTAISKNNIFYNSLCNGLGASSYVGDYNIFYNAYRPYNLAGFTTLSQYQSQYNNELHSQYLDPLFRNAEDPLGPDRTPFTPDDGFRLIPSSPARTAGEGGSGVGAYAIPSCTQGSPIAYRTYSPTHGYTPLRVFFNASLSSSCGGIIFCSVSIL
jgi:hypothetical protein